jgi:hypothetical protein
VANGSPTRDHPVAHYFRGDALARHGDWPLAQRYFTKATQPDGHFALAWNALGVAHAYQDHFKDAKDCFKRATQEDGNLADAYANFGTLLLIIEAGPGAIENYRRALDESKEFALANNGRACVKLAYNRDKQSLNEAVADFNIALAKAETKALVESNMRRVLAASAGVSEEEIKPEALKGMTLHARDLVGLSPDVLDRQLGSMSSSQLRGLLHETNRHAGNVELGKFLFGGTDVRIGGELGAVGAFGPIGAFANLFGEGRQSMAGWEAHLDYRGGELRALRETIIDHMTPGGADTVAVALEQSAGDMGNWPTKDTRFGLVPLAKLPHVTKPGK